MNRDLEKLAAGAVPSSNLLDAAREPLRLARDPSPTPVRVGGSWAASYWLEASTDEDGYSVPGGRQYRCNRLGLPGFPEIDFRPYDFGTNRGGDRGPSLAGHQVSFEVVGPTVRSPFLDIQWVLTDNAGSGKGDVLAIDDVGPRTELGSPAYPDFGNTPSIKNMFGIDAMPAAGLYLTISQTGAHAWVDNAGLQEGGLPDGVAGSTVRTDREPIEKLRPESGFEVFRVAEVGEDYLVLDAAKHVSDHFRVAAVPRPVVRAITLLRPAAARLVAVPDPTGQRATTYAFVPPGRSLCGDTQPPFTTWTIQDPGCHLVWAGYAPQPNFGEASDYGEAVALPVPRPVGSGAGHLQGRAGDPAPKGLPIGRWAFYLDGGDTPRSGQVLRIHSVERMGGASTWLKGTSASLADPGISRVLGWFEVLDVLAGTPQLVVLRRLPEFDPETGVSFDPPQDAFWLQGAAPGQDVSIGFTVHDPVDSLWRRPVLDLDALESARLRGLIPPEDSGRSVEAADGQIPGQTPHRPDRAAFVTAGGLGACANPGNLLDLGFRVVLYPARVGASGDLEPDFDRPLPSENLILDPAVQESQRYWVDYAAATLTLSHPPAPGPGCELCPDPSTLSTGDNPRAEVVVFAAFVARSMEPTGPVRVLGAASVGEDPDPCAAGGSEAADPASYRVWFRLAPQRIDTLGYPDRMTIDLDAPYDPLALPESGYVELLAGTSTDAPPMFRDALGRHVSTVGYERVGKWGTPDKIRLLGCYGGGIGGSFYDVTPAAPGLAVLRRTVSTPSDTAGRPGTDYRRDLSYGAAGRPPAIRFAGSQVRRLGDGSVEVQLRDARAASHERLFRDLFSPSVLSGCWVSTIGPNTVRVEAGWALLAGVRGRVPETAMLIPDGVSYVYLSGADPCHPRVALFPMIRPLPGPEDVPLARVTASGGLITEVLPLQLYLRDIDYRFDIFVGRRQDRNVYGEPTPHFDTLAAAVHYVGELLDPESGMSGYQVRIRVVGPTQETELPIRIPCDGLVIEGVSTMEQGSAPARSWGVCWDLPAGSLIDLMGHRDVAIRDLALVYNAPMMPPHAAPDRVAITSSVPSQPVRNLVLENVHLYGHDQCQGLLYIPAPAGGLVSSQITSCRTDDVTDLGVYVEFGSSDLRVENCSFRASNVTRAMTGLAGPAGVFLGPSADNASQSIVSGMTIQGFQVGIQVDRHQARVTTTDVRGSYREAFLVTNGAEVELVSCQGVDICLEGAPKFGIRATGALRFAARGCRVDLQFAGPADYSLFMQSSPFSYVADYFTRSNIKVDDHGTIVGASTTGRIDLGDNASVSRSQAGQIISGQRCQISSSQFGTVLGSSVGNHTIARGCTFQDVQIDTSSVLDGCTIDGVFSVVPGAQNCAVLNSFFGPNVLQVDVAGSIFRGCRFLKTFVLRGSRNTVEANYFQPVNDANLVLQGFPASRVVQCQVRGNILTGLGGIFLDADQCIISGNTVVSGETFAGSSQSIVAMGDQNIVSGNSVFQHMAVGMVGAPRKANCVVLANQIVGNLYCDVTNSTVAGNRVDGKITLLEGTAGTGNVCQSVEVVDRCVVSGNHTTLGGITGTGEGYVAAGNWVEGAITLAAGEARSAVSGNIAGQVMANKHGSSVISGNWLSNIFAQLANQSVFSGNYVDDYIDARAGQPVVVGNRLRTGNITVLRDRTFVVVGNSGPALDAPPTPTDPDPAPNQAVAMGNRLGSIFGAPGDGRARGNAV